MRKGVMLTQRDFEILKHLAYGPATDRSIYETFFEKENGNIRTRKRVMLRRLKKLEQEKLIKTKFNPRISRSIYVLERTGAVYAADKFGLEVSNMWCHFPKNADIFHDIIVSGIAKRIVKDVKETNPYELDFIIFENYLKKEIGAKVKKGIYYPDLQVGVSFAPERFFTFDIEVDCGTISRRDFLGKITSFKNTVLISATTEERLNLLYRYLKHMRVNKGVYITLHKHIFNEGFFKCEWYDAFSQRGFIHLEALQ